MKNVVAFLLEHFPDIQACPTGQNLSHILHSEGFAEQDINDVITIIELLNDTPETQPESPALRIYHAEEADMISPPIRGLLHFLHNSGTISFTQRELIIHALMHLPDDHITADNAKVLTLLVLWAHRSEFPLLIGDELLTALHDNEHFIVQ